jgi:hypothetical protein
MQTYLWVYVLAGQEERAVNRWVEERVEAVRLALRIREFPEEGDLDRLVEWLDGCIRVRYSPVEVGMCVHREDHRAVITLPEGITGPELDLILAEELGHYLLTRGMAALLRGMSEEEPRLLRLARRWEWGDEALVREFVQAWFLPSCLVQGCRDDDELCYRSRCAPAVVRRRRESLAGQVVELEGPPRWSAGREYRLVEQAVSGQPLLQVVRRGEREPRFLLPAGEEGARGAALQLSADLIALTSVEWEIKYGPFRCEGAQPVEISIEELEAWAGRDSRG